MIRNKVLVEVSNKHVHLSREDINALFGKDYKLEIKRKLSQPGQFVALERVTLLNKDRLIENVKILGPERNKTQVELTKKEALILNMNPPVRNSGDIDNTPGLVIKGPKGSVVLTQGVILVKKHLHASEDEAKSLRLKENQIINVKTGKFIIKDVIVRTHPQYKLAVHISKDEGDSLGISKTAQGELIL